LAIEKGTAKIEYVGGQKLFPETSPGPGLVESIPLPEPGVLIIAHSKGDPSFIAVNYFDPQESNTLNIRPYPFPNKVEAGLAKSDEQSSFAKQIGRIVLALLFLDLLFNLFLAKRLPFRSQRVKAN
jgi:hypothetical protein